MPIGWVSDFDLPENPRGEIQDEEASGTHLSFNLNVWEVNNSECMSNSAYFRRSRELCQHIQRYVHETSM